jgi:hypothetical protein
MWSLKQDDCPFVCAAELDLDYSGKGYWLLNELFSYVPKFVRNFGQWNCKEEFRI